MEGSRGTMRTYSRQGHRGAAGAAAAITTITDAVTDFEDEDLQPRKRVRMDVTGKVVEEEVFVSAKSTRAGMETGTGTGNPSDEVQASSSTVPSSPPRSERALFSDDTLHDVGSVSPLSSPPPELPSPPPATRKPAFAFLKRKRLSSGDASSDSPSEPLAEVTHNIVKTRRGRRKSRLTQMQIDLGGEIRRTCKMCGMEFIPSNKEDAALHEEFCAIGSQGVDISQAMLKDKGITRLHITEGSRRSKEFIAIVDRRSSRGAKKQVRRVLEIVNAELSASDITNEELWEVIHSAPAASKSRNPTKSGSKTEEPEAPGDRFKVFMYLVDAKCAGFCLAEKISTAHRVAASENAESQQQTITPLSKSSSISISADADVALIGISRIWTSRKFRNKGIATMLLDSVRGNFFYGMEVPKDLVAFSQPSESGGRLAMRWFEAKTGWHVYTKGKP